MAMTPIMESLESRQLLAGNVLAIVAGSNLTLRGDALDNGIASVVQDGAAITITPDATTSVNGQPAGTPVAVNVPNLQLLRLQMGGGADSVNVTAQTILGVDTAFVARKGVNANLGAGSDVLTLFGVTTRSIAVNAHTGDNVVIVGAFDGATTSVPTTVAGSVGIKANAGIDTVDVIGTAIGGSLNVRLDGGSNVFVMAPGGISPLVGNTIGDDLVYSGGAGSDTVVVTGAAGARVLVRDDVRIALGGGDDLLQVVERATVNGFFNVTGPKGTKNIILDDLIVHDGVSIHTGIDNDVITILGLQDARNLNVNPGIGHDTLTIDRGTFQAQTNVTGWTYVRMVGASATLNMAHITGYSALLVGGKGVNTLNYDNLSINYNLLPTLINFVI